MEFQDKEGRNDRLKMRFEENLKNGKTKKRKKTKGQPPLAQEQDAPEAKVLEEIDRATQMTKTMNLKETAHQQPLSRLD